MSYNITIARISEDLTKSLPISKEDWEGCTTLEEIEFKQKETYPNCYLEVQLEVSNEYIPCFWISKDFKMATIDSKVFLINREFEKYAIKIANRLNAIIFGQEGELYYIPNIGKFESEKYLLDQTPITISELKDRKIEIGNEKEVLEYLKTKQMNASS